MKKLTSIPALPENAKYDMMDSPVGKLFIIGSTQGLHAILWENDRNNPKYANLFNSNSRKSSEPVIVNTKEQLAEYFAGKRIAFELPLAVTGTEFQIKAWQALLKIPYAKTLSYGEQAARVGNKNKARAVGMANGKNPISIVVPCHRVIGSNGKLTGFGGGIDNKEYLLNLEKNTEFG